MKLSQYRLPIFLILLALSASLQAQDEPASPLPVLRPLAQAWNDALSKADMSALLPLYAEEVNAYGRTMTQQACIEGKQAWLAKNAGYKQLLGEDFFVRTTPEGNELSFTKTTITAGKRKTFDAYLVFDRETNKIVRESDLSTDATLAKALKGNPLPQGTHCFIATGGVFPEIAVPTFYELHYKITIQGVKVTGEGSYYSWAMRSMNTLEISGTVLPDNSLNLTVTSFGPLYPDDENDKMTWKEVRKFDGDRLIWAGGTQTEYREMENTDCE
jgi:hypothetical protein